MTYTLLGSQISYFTGKARAYLRWKGVPFREELATRDVYKSIILPRVGWAVVPVLITPDGETVQDTSDIIDHVEAAEGGGKAQFTCKDGRTGRLERCLFQKGRLRSAVRWGSALPSALRVLRPFSA